MKKCRVNVRGAYMALVDEANGMDVATFPLKEASKQNAYDWAYRNEYEITQPCVLGPEVVLCGEDLILEICDCLHSDSNISPGDTADAVRLWIPADGMTTTEINIFIMEDEEDERRVALVARFPELDKAIERLF